MDVIALDVYHIHALGILLTAKAKAETNGYAEERLRRAINYLRTEHQREMTVYFADPEPATDIPF